jgi:Xaa-Pro aminopeptidase
VQNYLSRLALLQNLLEQSESVDSLVISPGPDLRYLTGYDAIPLERLTALVMRAGQAPYVLSPLLEKAAALASPIGAIGLDIRTWSETENPFEMVAGTLPKNGSFAVDGRMWADKLLRLQAQLPEAKSSSANQLISALRMKKSSDEIESLRAAGSAIDSVHAQVAGLLKVGRTEAEVGSDIERLIIESGHARVDFVIVGSGPNSASPHHEVSDRVICAGDIVVVDIGGTMPDGYCSDSTRTYSMGETSQSFRDKFEVLHHAQQLATQAVKPGVSCESIDQTARDYMTAHGIGEYFIHRIGHGIGMETHEEPYMVAGNKTLLEVGMAFSIEPGFYVDGQAGARIEDIVICGEAGADVLNNRPRELVEVEI